MFSCASSNWDTCRLFVYVHSSQVETPCTVHQRWGYGNRQGCRESQVADTDAARLPSLATCRGSFARQATAPRRNFERTAARTSVSSHISPPPAAAAQRSRRRNRLPMRAAGDRAEVHSRLEATRLRLQIPGTPNRRPAPPGIPGRPSTPRPFPFRFVPGQSASRSFSMLPGSAQATGFLPLTQKPVNAAKKRPSA